MARQCEFSHVEALNAVADLFAMHGFEGTSLAMILEATGLGKQSLYNAFGDKTELYLKAVEHSVARFGVVLPKMEAAPTGRAALVVFFEHLLVHCTSTDPAKRACIVSAGLLEGVGDARLQLTMQSKWSATRAALRASIVRGQGDGSIANTSPPGVLADLLMALMSGLRVMARAGPDATRLRQTAEVGLRQLDLV